MTRAPRRGSRSRWRSCRCSTWPCSRSRRCSAGAVLSPLAFIGALAAVLLAIVARRRVARVYALGEQAFQPVEAELIHARALSAWALGVALAALPVYALFVAVLLYF